MFLNLEADSILAEFRRNTKMMDPVTPPAITVTIEEDKAEKTEFSFTNSFQIGRGTECDVRIKDDVVSRHHAEIRFEEGQWRIYDLKSANGILVDGEQVEQAPLQNNTRIRLGQIGPLLSVSIEKIKPAEKVKVDRHSLARYTTHYFGDADDADIGEHTMMVRRAFAKIQNKQKKKYAGIIAIFALMFMVAGTYAIYKHRQVRQQRELAADIFYNMKTLEIEIGKVIKDVKKRRNAESKKQIEEFRAKQQQLERNYNRFVDTLNVYGKGLSQEERIILHISRRFGECEVNMPEGFVKEVMKYVEKWKSTRRLERAIKRARSRGYISEIVQTLSMHNLPPQFFYLALQESNLNPNACGPETRFGIAKGMWQFIPSTAEVYDLNTGPLVDEPIPDPDDDRHDFRKSTLAAARYLKDIYTTDAQASGLLVMASYNWGEDRVIKLIESMPENPRERNFWQLISQYRNKIPAQTYDYVFSIFSAAVIGENPGLFGFEFDNPLASVIHEETKGLLKNKFTFSHLHFHDIR